MFLHSFTRTSICLPMSWVPDEICISVREKVADGVFIKLGEAKCSGFLFLGPMHTRHYARSEAN